MNATLCPRTETYLDTEPMLGKIVARYLQRHKGGIDDGMDSFDDALSEAKIIYFKSLENWDGKKSKLRTWVWNRVSWGLVGVKEKALHPKRKPPERSPLSKHLTTREPSAVEAMLADASQDAQAIMRLLFECPGRWVDENKPWTTRRLLVDLLLEIGWTGERILESFREIKELIS